MRHSVNSRPMCQSKATETFALYLQWVEQVVEAPSDDDVIVESDKEGDDAAGNANATKPRMDCVPDPQGAQPHLLSHPQFHQEQGDSLQDQHHSKWNQEGSCYENIRGKAQFKCVS